jgi:hypothetical protein
MKRDLGNMIATFQAFAPQTIGITGAQSVTGATLDRFGYESILFVFTNGTSAHGAQALGITITGKIQESATGSSWADVSGATSTHNITNTYSRLEVAVADATQLKRYVRGVLTASIDGAGNFQIVDGVAIFGAPKTYPV